MKNVSKIVIGYLRGICLAVYGIVGLAIFLQIIGITIRLEIVEILFGALMLWFFDKFTFGFLLFTERLSKTPAGLFLCLIMALLGGMLLLSDSDGDKLSFIQESSFISIVDGYWELSADNITIPITADSNRDLINDYSSLYNLGLWSKGLSPSQNGRIRGNYPVLCEISGNRTFESCSTLLESVYTCLTLPEELRAGRVLTQVGARHITCTDLDVSDTSLRKNLRYFSKLNSELGE